MNDSSSTAQDPATTPDVVTTNDAPHEATNYHEIGTKMTAEQEQDYIAQVLDNGQYTPKIEEVAKDGTPPPVADTLPIPEVPVIEAPKTPEVPLVETKEIAAPQTDDLWVEVERVVTDELGEETTEKIKLTYDPNDPSSFIPDDFTAKNTKQLAEIMEAKSEMAAMYKERESEYNDAQSAKDVETQQQAQIDSWNTEVQDLVEAGVIPDPTKDEAKYTEKTDAVYLFMAAENNKRMQDGRSPIVSFGTAFTMHENNEAVKTAAAEKVKEDADTKAKGAMVGGSSAASGGSAEPKAYIAGSHRNIWSVPVDD